MAALFLVALAVPVGAAGPPGNNGTVKIHNVGETARAQSRDPERAARQLLPRHFFFADTQQAGDWWITGQPPTGGDTGTAERHI